MASQLDTAITHQHGADKDDLLIRSLSSLLNLVKTQLREGTTIENLKGQPPRKKPLEQLDRLALLFVTSKYRQVVAVAASESIYGVVLFVEPDAQIGGDQIPFGDPNS